MEKIYLHKNTSIKQIECVAFEKQDYDYFAVTLFELGKYIMAKVVMENHFERLCREFGIKGLKAEYISLLSILTEMRAFNSQKAKRLRLVFRFVDHYYLALGKENKDFEKMLFDFASLLDFDKKTEPVFAFFEKQGN